MDLEFQDYSTLPKYAFQNRYQEFEETKNLSKEELGTYPFDKMEEECGVFGVHSTETQPDTPRWASCRWTAG